MTYYVLPIHAKQWNMSVPENLGKLLIIEREGGGARDLRLLLVDEDLGW